MQSSNERLYTFVAGKTGTWKILSCRAVIGETLPPAARVEVAQGMVAFPGDDTSWMLRGVTSDDRYVTAEEKNQLQAAQVALGRAQARHAALIPIRKNAAWWAMSQGERRAIFEDRSHHIQTGLKYLPGVAGRLHHCRDLAEREPFDFITFFDYPSTELTAFEDLVSALRKTEEWKYVDREIDIRLVRDFA